MADSKIEYEVMLVNSSNNMASVFSDVVRNILKDYIGKKITTKRNVLIKEIQNKIHSQVNPHLPVDLVMEQKYFNDINLKVVSKHDEYGADYTLYINLAKIKDHVLVNILYPKPLRCDYTIDEVRKVINRVEELKKEISEIEKKYPEFFS